MRPRVAAGPKSDRPGTLSRNIRKKLEKPETRKERVLPGKSRHSRLRNCGEAGTALESPLVRNKRSYTVARIGRDAAPLKPRQACVPSTTTTTKHQPEKEKAARLKPKSLTVVNV